MFADASGSAEEAWDRGGEQKRILNGLSVILNLDEAHMFKDPIDLYHVPDYCKVVAYPTDLSTIQKKLANGVYRYDSFYTAILGIGPGDKATV